MSRPEPLRDHHPPADDLPYEVSELGVWSEWRPFIIDAVRTAPTAPGVYLFRQGTSLVYVGQAGVRNGKGVRGRLTSYVLGRATHSGLGNLALERALQDPDWLRARLGQVEGGARLTVQDWCVLALQRADLEVCWSRTADPQRAVSLERAVLDALRVEPLWNRRR